MNLTFNLIAFILFSSFASLLAGGRYYIDPSAKYNGDGSRGTPASGPAQPGAFNTWPQYLNSYGDRYYQKCGTSFTVPWQDGIQLKSNGGSIGNETVLGAYYLDANYAAIIGVSGDMPILTGLTVLPGWQDESHWRNEGSNIWSYDFGTTSPYRLWIDGSERLMAGFNPAVEDAFPHGVGRINPLADPPTYWCHETYPPEGGGDNGRRLYVFSTDNPATTYSVMAGLQAIDRLFTIRDADYVIVENLDLRAARICLFIDRSSHVTIQKCHIGKGANLGVLTRGTIIDGASFTTSYGVIKECVIDADFHFKGYAYEDQGPHNGIEMKDGTNYWQIFRNEIKNWGHSGVNIFSLANDSPAMPSNYNRVYENLFTAPEASHCRAFNLSGAAPGRCSGNEIFRNYIFDLPTRSQIIADDNRIYYNIFDTMRNDFYYLHNETWHSAGGGLQIWAGDDNRFCQNNRIFNNIFYNMGEAAIRLISWDDGQFVQNNEIANNILFNCGVNANSGRESFTSGEYAGAALVIEAWRASDDDMIRNNVFMNNLIFNAGSDNVVRYKGQNMTVADFNAAGTPSEKIGGNIQSDPGFVNASSGDFWLMPNSSAAGKAYNLGDDYANALAPGMARRYWPGPISTIHQTTLWDIGAFKYKEAFDHPPKPPVNVKIEYDHQN
jgi:hypothetical protein